MYKLSIIDNDNLPFLKYIASGEKKAEGRVASEFIRNLKIGEKLLLFSKAKFVICNIKYLHFYDSFENMLALEGLQNMVPFVETTQKALDIYYSFPGAHRVKKLGCCAIGLDFFEEGVYNKRNMVSRGALL